jgi:two-component system, cell cycle response regulator
MQFSLSDKTILYVEDHEFERHGLEEFLKNMVKRVYLGSNGKQGLELYHACSPDIILTDIKMPVMDGLEMIAHIRKFDINIPVIIITASNDFHFLDRSRELGVSKFVQKPIDFRKLVHTLNSCVHTDCGMNVKF